MDVKENTSLLSLRKRLEELNVFKQLGTFQFWDVDECCMIDGDFEALNSIRDSYTSFQQIQIWRCIVANVLV
jgi:hypothetical protein